MKIISNVSNTLVRTTRATVKVVENYFLSLDSLSKRRKLADIMLAYDILNNFIECPQLLFEIGFRISIIQKYMKLRTIRSF